MTTTRIVGVSASGLIASFILHSLVVAAPVLSFNESTGGAGLHTDTTLGWRFNVLQSLTVEGLGWFDEGANGLGVSHQIGIWNPAGVLLVDVTVPAGTVAPLDGQFRTAAISPIVLTPGTGYIVGGVSYAASADTERLACGNPDSGSSCFPTLAQSLDPRVQFTSAMYSSSPSFVRPAIIGVSSQGYYGPSFSVQSIPVPEPATAFLSFVAGFGVLMRLKTTASVRR